MYRPNSWPFLENVQALPSNSYWSCLMDKESRCPGQILGQMPGSFRTRFQLAVLLNKLFVWTLCWVWALILSRKVHVSIARYSCLAHSQVIKNIKKVFSCNWVFLQTELRLAKSPVQCWFIKTKTQIFIQKWWRWLILKALINNEWNHWMSFWEIKMVF